MVKIAVLGYGTVGSGVVEVLKTNQKLISANAGDEIEVKHVLDLRDFPDDPIQEKIVHDYSVILNDPEIQIVVEVMGGVNPAYSFVKQALLSGKSVATSNKELVAKHGAELISIAKQQQINFFFEASVGGGIPIIRPLQCCLTADEIDEISGILNGTTNYVLSEMTFQGSDFEEVLREAQELGYAERNPQADVEGFDAGRKIAILTSLVSGRQVDFEDVYTEGITKISSADMKYAKKLNCIIKLLARSRRKDGQTYVMVAPFLIGPKHPLYSVNGVLNAVYVHGNMLGDTMFFGSGAGKLPTASAVVSDVVEAARHLHDHVEVKWSQEKMPLGKIADYVSRFFVRVKEEDQEAACSLFGSEKIVDAGIAGEVGLITRAMTEEQFAHLAESVSLLSRIRID